MNAMRRKGSKNGRDRRYKCNTCKLAYKRPGNLARHVKDKHRYIDTDSEIEITDEMEMEKHVCENRRYECYLCKEYFTTSLNQIEKHIQSHTGPAPSHFEVRGKHFICEIRISDKS